MLSAIHDASTTEVRTRTEGKEKPDVCIAYNDKMGGVGLSVAYLASYPISRKRIKTYYNKQFLLIMDMATLNAFILYEKNGAYKLRLAFILFPVNRLVEENHRESHPRTTGRPSSTDTPLRLHALHYLVWIPPTANKEKPTRRCHACYSHNIRTETPYMCQQCGKALCIVPCFRIFHTVVNY